MPEPAFLNDRYIRTDAVLALIRTVLRRLLLASAGIAAVSVLVGALVAGLAGVWAGLLAAGISLVFTATTVLALYLVAGRGPELLQIVLLGGWLVKMALLAVALLWLRDQDFYHRGVFLGTLFVAVIAAVLVELITVASSKVPYVTPQSAVASQDGSQADVGPGDDRADAPAGESADPHPDATDEPSQERHNPRA
ncbi:hypothetical protein [Ruania rhizosphaerae]|uniref:hypothetical protein n=1 Tax=Ruania rhizosphaerae TaxID=1840413 RepID=UPI00135C1375|nr:hypothetical protein [Ruania rhizosphaerae]